MGGLHRWISLSIWFRWSSPRRNLASINREFKYRFETIQNCIKSIYFCCSRWQRIRHGLVCCYINIQMYSYFVRYNPKKWSWWKQLCFGKSKSFNFKWFYIMFISLWPGQYDLVANWVAKLYFENSLVLSSTRTSCWFRFELTTNA